MPRRCAGTILPSNFARTNFDVVVSQDDRPVRLDRFRKTSGSEPTFPEHLTKTNAIEAGVTAMADDV
jgi:hypothetical protein